MVDEQSYTAETARWMLLFSLASSSLLILNKLCMHNFHTPALISTLQFAVTTLTCIVLMTSGAVEPDGWEWRKVKPYLLYVTMFVMTIYANMRALQHSNVETIIVFRSACPVIVCFLDWGFLGRQLPSARSVLSLLAIICGCVGYVLTDHSFRLKGWGAYTWATVYALVLSIEMTYGKHVAGPHLGFASMWGPTLYANTLSIIPMATLGLLSHELHALGRVEWSGESIGLLALSCAVGVAISFLGWRVRSILTAACYTVLGVANKMLTVFASALIWNDHASMLGVLSLGICLAGSASYKQAPMAECGEDDIRTRLNPECADKCTVRLKEETEENYEN